MIATEHFSPPSRRFLAIRRSARFALAAAAWLLLGLDEPRLAPSSEPVFLLTKSDGSKLAGRLRRLDAETGVVLIDEKGQEQRVAASDWYQLVREESPSPLPGQGAIILLPEGDRLMRVTIRKATDTHLEIQSFGLDASSVPLESMIGVIPQAPIDASATARLVAQVRETPRTEEMVWLANGDTLSGGFVGFGEKLLKFRPATGPVELDRSNVTALGFDPSLATYPRPKGVSVEVSFVDGSRLGLSEFRVEGSSLVGKARYGGEIKAPLSEVAVIQARSDAIRFLSDVPALQDRYREYIGPTRPYKRDANVLGGPLVMQSRRYEHGMGVQPRTLLAYRIDGSWSRFKASVGLDEASGSLAHVVFRVIVDGKEAASSPAMAARDAPHRFDVDIRNANTLILVTEFGERGNVHDVADWAEARLTR